MALSSPGDANAINHSLSIQDLILCRQGKHNNKQHHEYKPTEIKIFARDKAKKFYRVADICRQTKRATNSKRVIQSLACRKREKWAIKMIKRPIKCSFAVRAGFKLHYSTPPNSSRL